MPRFRRKRKAHVSTLSLQSERHYTTKEEWTVQFVCCKRAGWREDSEPLSEDLEPAGISTASTNVRGCPPVAASVFQDSLAGHTWDLWSAWLYQRGPRVYSLRLRAQSFCLRALLLCLFEFKVSFGLRFLPFLLVGVESQVVLVHCFKQ